MTKHRQYAIPPLALFLAILLLGPLSGCGPGAREILQAGLDRGESLLIFPRPREHVEWSSAGGILSVDPTGEARYGEDSDGLRVVPVGDKYAAVSVPPGVYRLSAITSSVKAGERELKGAGSFASRFDEVRVEKTPRKKYVRERVWIPPEYEWVSDGDGRGYYAEVWPGYWETRTRINYVTSYLVSRLEPAQVGAGGELASFTVGTGQTALIPAIWGEIGLADGSCRFVGDEVAPGYRALAGTSGTYTSYMGGGGSERDFYIQVYQCPVDKLSVMVIPADEADLRHWVDPSDLPAGVLERGVILPDIHYGPLFSEPHQSRPVRFEDKRFFSRNVVWQGVAHVFPGREGAVEGGGEKVPGSVGEEADLPAVP